MLVLQLLNHTYDLSSALDNLFPSRGA